MAPNHPGLRFWRYFFLATLLLGSAGPAWSTIQCFNCHGTATPPDYRPLDAPVRDVATGGFLGNHRTHLAATAGPTNCEPCHPGSQGYVSSHRDGKIQLAANLNGSPQPARYRNITTPQPQTALPVAGSCANVNCHFEQETPLWGSASLTFPDQCASCHAVPPTSGSHPAASGSGKKHGDYYGTGLNSCAVCHPDHGAAPAPFAHATSVGKGPLKLSFSAAPNNGAGSYSGNLAYPNFLPSANPPRNGACSDLYCHSDGKGGAPLTVPTWGATMGGCVGCHDTGGTVTQLSGRHGRHTDASGYAFTCNRCHNGTVVDNTTIANRSSHVNRSKELIFREGGSYSPIDQACNAYCHSNAGNGPPVRPVKWNDTGSMTCYSCHRGRTVDNTEAACTSIGGTWNSTTELCAPYVNISSNGHARLVGPQWVRKYPCSYCHSATIPPTLDGNGTIVGDGPIDKTHHLNGDKNVLVPSQWSIAGRPDPVYDPQTKICANVYCHSDGTADPEQVRPLAWNVRKTACNTCHGHPVGSCSAAGCHDGETEVGGRILPRFSRWTTGQEWKAAMPMFANVGPGTGRANSHVRHLQTDFSCDDCHFATIKNGICTDCHNGGLPTGSMSEVAHINPEFHVNKTKDVVFRNNSGSFNRDTKTCSNTRCHTGGADPQWGASVKNAIVCQGCHGSTVGDLDDFGSFNGLQAKIGLSEWTVSGHGRPASAGNYPVSGNPPANFPGNPCWYCHDSSVLHKDTTNPFRLRKHNQFLQRFEKECVFCHLVGRDDECLGCHNSTAGTLAPQLASTAVIAMHGGSTILAGCSNGAGCHPDDAKRHKTRAGSWTEPQKADIRNQYVMMGVCLKCHDDDSGGRCTSCHTAPGNNPNKYTIGFDGGSGFIKPQKARASSVHFGYKHWRAQQQDSTTWKGGKFCWDCHDPHGDSNIYMIQNKVATTTDGTFGLPKTRSDVLFTNKQSGQDYATKDAPFNKICNVCHASDGRHYRRDGGDGHNLSRPCTICHEHRFTDSHANKQSCDSCHRNRPVPRHSAFGLPRDCTKCHAGTIGNRMDVMGQLKGNSHHVQGVEATGKHCYACHWEAQTNGLIDLTYHAGFNYQNYTSVKNAEVDLVVWGAGSRPTTFRETSSATGRTTAVRFLANRITTPSERSEVAKLNTVCIACHSDQNNNTTPFDDCKTPRQYAWDGQSIATRYGQLGTTTWGKYSTANANRKGRVVKAFSAHGNAVKNAGGWDTTTGQDGIMPNTRNGAQNVQCYDCHNSHGSKVVGVTTSYVTFNGTKNGGNLKETVKGKGGYNTTYKATFANVTGIGRYNAGAGQCFDCHETANPSANTGTPWGYSGTFGASQPIFGYKDTPRFGQGTKGSMQRFPYRSSRTSIVGSHMRASSYLNYSATGSTNGLCTPCHDPHGVSPTLGADREYAVPLLKGTWLTSPYREDAAQTYTGAASGYLYLPSAAKTDRNTLSPDPSNNNYRIKERDEQFAGLCLRCHRKEKLSDGVNKNTAWKSMDRVHETVQGWGANAEHSYACAKCHQPHNSGLPRLLQTNCLDFKHRGQVATGGQPMTGSAPNGNVWGFPRGGQNLQGPGCHSTNSRGSGVGGGWPNGELWNQVTPW